MGCTCTFIFGGRFFFFPHKTLRKKMIALSKMIIFMFDILALDEASRAVRSKSSTWFWSSSPPSVSWLKLTLDPEWCLVRSCAGGPGRTRRGSEEQMLSRDVSLVSGASTRLAEEPDVKRSSASPSWALKTQNNQSILSTIVSIPAMWLCLPRPCHHPSPSCSRSSPTARLPDPPGCGEKAPLGR